MFYQAFCLREMKTIIQKSYYYQNLIRLAIPIIIGQLGVIIVGFADTIMVGHHSTEELAAASFVNNVLMAFITFGMGFSYHLTPLVGDSFGKGKRMEVGGWLKNSLLANLVMALVLMAGLGLLYMNIERMGQPSELIPLIKPYFVVCWISIAFVMLYNTFRQFMEAIGEPDVSMWILLIGNLFNILGNYLLIYGKAGLPELGLFGAGISTLVSRMLMVLLYVLVFLYKKNYQAYRKGFVSMGITRDRFRTLNLLGWPIGIQQGLEAATFSITAVMIGWLGSIQLAAHQIAITFSTVCYTILLGLGSAVAIRNSYYKGVNQWSDVQKSTWAGVQLGLVVAAILCLVLFVIRKHVSSWFTDSQEVSELVVQLLPVLMLYQFADSVQINFANALRGVAEVKSIMWVSVVVYFVIAIPCGYILGFILEWGCAGIWMAYPIGFLLAGWWLGRKMSRIVSANQN